MADLTDLQSAQTAKIVGADSNGVETQFLTVGTDGRAAVTAVLLDGTKATYSAAVTAVTMASNASDLFTITGSATKTIRVLSVAIEFAGGGAVPNVQLLKRSTANAGGTFTATPPVPHDSTNNAATAVIRAYTANPTTLGTLVGTVRAAKTNSPLASSAVDPVQVMYDFGIGPRQGIVLRGINEVLAWNFNGASLSANFAAHIEWTEE